MEKLDGTVMIGLNAVIVAVTDESPRVLTVRSSLANGDTLEGLPFGPLDPTRHRTLEKGLRGWVEEQTGLRLGYVEQLYTFGDGDRVPSEWSRGNRVVSIAYLALVREHTVCGRGTARWRNFYASFPWEDRRAGVPRAMEELTPRLLHWAGLGAKRGSRRLRQERVAIAFGLEGATWDGERVLERYELLYEAGLVLEASRVPVGAVSSTTARESVGSGRAMALDHRRMMATALGRLRGKIKYRPVVFELLPATFTLYQLQRVVEALAGVRLHKQNFRRLVERGGLVEGTGQLETQTGGRPAELFRFRREVLRERRAPGVGQKTG
jgi:hypothetical protein